ncbi:MAG: magnesium/cobalt transporter CorA [Nanoarchaeota archaeon]|nr:magnesium/cobalt transporter CorA [Nanoarchaeota archaeon]
MINVVYFKKKTIMESNVSEKRALDLIKSKNHCWIDVIDASKEDIARLLKILFPKYHSLIFEDCIEETRPKIDFYENFVFMVFKVYSKNLTHSQINIILGKDFIISIRKSDLDLNPVYKFFENTQKTSDFVLYKILALMFDKRYVILEKEEEELNKFENLALIKPTPQLLRKMLRARRKISSFKRNLLHEREVLTILVRDEIPFIKKETRVFLKDAYDDIVHLMDVCETLREVVSNAIDIYLSSVSNKMNEIMKTLTVIASFVWIPTLIAGIYGMNFRNVFPNWTNVNGFFIALSLMVISVVLFYVYFKRKRWL